MVFATSPEAYLAQAAALVQQGQHAAAVPLLAQARALYPTHAPLQFAEAELRVMLGALGEALGLYGALLEQHADFFPAYEAAGNILTFFLTQGGLAAPQQQACAQQLASLRVNQGNAMLRHARLGEAAQAYRAALQANPQSAGAHGNLANLLCEIGQPSAAEQHAREAVRLAPQSGEAWNSLGTALAEQGRQAEADAAIDEALMRAPQTRSALLNASHGRLFRLLYQPDLAAQAIADAHVAWGATQPSPAATPMPAMAAGRVRVGFISADLREHAMMHFLLPLFTHLDRARFDLFAYANHPLEDAVSRQMQQTGVQWRNVHALDDAALIAQLQADDLHVLIDLSGHTTGNRLSALAVKPVPVLAHWLGYMFTTGAPVFDYRITDRWTDPPETAERLHCETVIYLDRCQFVYRPREHCPEVAPLSALARGAITFGSLNHFAKLNDAVIASWSAILQRVPNSRLWLQTKLLADAAMAARLRQDFVTHGIDGERLELRAASDDYLASYHAIDIALDPFPYAGGATSCDALWMGVPVLTLAGDRSVGRMGVSLLAALGMEEWIAADRDDYLARAVRFATDLPALAALRASLRPRFEQSPLRDEHGFAEAMGKCLESMVAHAAYEIANPR